MKKASKLIALIIVLILSVGGCTDDASPSGLQGQNQSDPKDGGTIKMGCVPIDTLNPLVTKHATVSDFLSLVYEGLFAALPNLEAKPVLASECIASNDNTTYTIKLKGGVKFHSGKAFGAEDVIATLYYINMYGGKYSSVANLIASYSATSDDTVVIALKSPVADFANLLDFPILPSGLTMDDFSAANSSFVPVGTGMYAYEGKDEHKNIYLKANEAWHTGKRAHIDRVDVEILSNDETVISAFDAGAIDILSSSWKSPSEINLTSSLYQTYTTEQNRLTFLGMNIYAAAFDTKEERNAFVSSIDRTKLCADIMLGKAKESAFPVRENVYYIQGTMQDDMQNEDGTVSNKNIQKPSELVLVYNSDSHTKKRLAHAVKQQLDIAGYNTVLSAHPFATYTEKVKNSEYDLYIGEVNIDNALNLDFMFGHNRSAQNICLYESEELKTLVSNLNRMSGKENKSVAVENFKKYYRDNSFQISLYFTNGEAYVNKRIGGELTPNLSSLYHGFEELYIKNKK